MATTQFTPGQRCILSALIGNDTSPTPVPVEIVSVHANLDQAYRIRFIATGEEYSAFAKNLRPYLPKPPMFLNLSRRWQRVLEMNRAVA